MMTLHERIEELRAALPDDWDEVPGEDCTGHLDEVAYVLKAGRALGLPGWAALDLSRPLDEIIDST